MTDMSHSFRWLPRIALMAALTVQGCERKSDVKPQPDARMADTLAMLYARAVADPTHNQFLNRQRADALQSLSALGTGQQGMQNIFLLAQERLLAGQTAEAIDGFERLTRSRDVSLAITAERNKPFYDLLAISYLRLGEQQNCIGDAMAPNRCILPLSGGAKHTKEEGARKAIALYQQILGAYPNDRGSQWLLNLAYMAIGEYPDSVPRKWRIPGLATRHNAFPLFTNVAGETGVGITGLSGGVSVADFNRDGFLDIFTTSFGMNDPAHLLLNDGHGHFSDRTGGSGLKGIVGGLNNIHADYDSDGYEDIFVMRGAWLGDAAIQPNSLLHNRGDGTFEDVTFKAGLASRHPTSTAAWVDFNLDGKLDLFVGHESEAEEGGTSHRSELYLNNGDGTFREVSHKVGIDLDAFVKGVTWGDINNDGLPDLFVSVLNGPNRLFVNRGGTSIDNWKFEEVPDAGGAALPMMSFSTWFWDFDQDGYEDLMVLSYDIRNSGALHDAVAREYLGEKMGVESSRLYHNNGDGTFTDATRKFGLEDKVIFAMGANFGDLDNDGWLDFYVGTGNPDLRAAIPNRMFHNVNGKRFEEVTLEGGFGHLQKGHGAAFADFERKGNEDVFMVMGGAYQGDVATSVLFRNPGWAGRTSITLELEGTTSNRSAIGARVELIVADAKGAIRSLRRTVGAGGSFGSGPLELHVGLGNATTVRRLNITWPDRARTAQTFSDLHVSTAYHIVEGGQPIVVRRW